MKEKPVKKILAGAATGNDYAPALMPEETKFRGPSDIGHKPILAPAQMQTMTWLHTEFSESSDN